MPVRTVHRRALAPTITKPRAQAAQLGAAAIPARQVLLPGGTGSPVALTLHRGAAGTPSFVMGWASPAQRQG
jgi:hypothetical protein